MSFYVTIVIYVSLEAQTYGMPELAPSSSEEWLVKPLIYKMQQYWSQYNMLMNQ